MTQSILERCSSRDAGCRLQFAFSPCMIYDFACSMNAPVINTPVDVNGNISSLNKPRSRYLGKSLEFFPFYWLIPSDLGTSTNCSLRVSTVCGFVLQCESGAWSFLLCMHNVYCSRSESNVQI